MTCVSWDSGNLSQRVHGPYGSPIRIRLSSSRPSLCRLKCTSDKPSPPPSRLTYACASVVVTFTQYPRLQRIT